MLNSNSLQNTISDDFIPTLTPTQIADLRLQEANRSLDSAINDAHVKQSCHADPPVAMDLASSFWSQFFTLAPSTDEADNPFFYIARVSPPSNTETKERVATTLLWKSLRSILAR